MTLFSWCFGTCVIMAGTITSHTVMQCLGHEKYLLCFEMAVAQMA